jgi:plastocyanin
MIKLLRFAVFIVIFAAALALTPYVALPYGQLDWRNFQGAYETATFTPTFTVTATRTATATPTHTPTGTPTETPISPPDTTTPTQAPTETATATLTPIPPTATTTLAPTQTSTATGTAVSPTLTSTPTGSVTVTPSLTATPTPTETASPTHTPSATPTETLSALPDLVVTSMAIELQTGGDCNYTSTQLGVRVWIGNIGNADAGPFVVEVNGAQQTVTSGLAAGQTLSLWFAGYVPFGDNTAIVDATHQVTESNEDNNTLTQMLPIPTLPPTCTPTRTETATPTVTLTRTPTPTATPSGPVVNVQAADFQFVPKVITVTIGTTVRWTNTGQVAHTATSDTGVWDSGNLDPSQQFSYTFTQVGVYPSYCKYHGAPGGIGMAGRVVVVKPATYLPIVIRNHAVTVAESAPAGWWQWLLSLLRG